MICPLCNEDVKTYKSGSLRTEIRLERFKFHVRPRGGDLDGNIMCLGSYAPIPEPAEKLEPGEPDPRD